MTNPYQPPVTEIPEKFGINTKNGTLQDGINGNYDFLIMDVIKESWKKTYGIKGILVGAGFLILIGIFALGFILSILTEVLGFGADSLMPDLINQLVFTIVIYPFLAGMMMVGVRHAVDLDVSFSTVFGYFTYTIPIIIAALLMSFLTSIGMFLLVIPGVYLSMAYVLTIPLIIEKNLGPWEAMEASRKAITHHWFKVFFTYLIMGIIYILSILPLGLGLIWSIPMLTNIGGILYRIIFGVDEVQDSPSEESNDSLSFSSMQA
ncbi:MAG: hypothetical protein KAI17_02945 [Thiotrichaceae bacterium]|nr:hypothetical protein [Thiotrichaceae bacterium]